MFVVEKQNIMDWLLQKLSPEGELWPLMPRKPFVATLTVKIAAVWSRIYLILSFITLFYRIILSGRYRAEFTRLGVVKKIVIPAHEFPPNHTVAASFKDLWLARQQNKDLALQKLERMMDESNKPAFVAHK